MGTVWPSATLISFKTPAAGEGIFASTLSVEISKSGSSRSILSPGFFSHFVMVPSKMLSPICGMITSTAMVVSSFASVSRQIARSASHALHVGQEPLLERRRIGHRRIERRHAHYGAVEVLERAFADRGRNFARDSAGARVLVHDEQLVCLLHRRQNRL